MAPFTTSASSSRIVGSLFLWTGVWFARLARATVPLSPLAMAETSLAVSASRVLSS